MSLQKLHYENLGGTLVRREGLLSWRCPLCKAGGQSLEVMRTCPECGSKEATLPVAQPAPSVPEGFSREDLEAVAAGLDGYEKTVNVGNVTGEGDDHLESTTAYAARFIRAMLAAPEVKP